MTSSPTAKEIDDAIKVIGAALPHDAVERWLPSYEILLAAKRAIDRAYGPAVACQLGAMVVGGILIWQSDVAVSFAFTIAALFVFPALVGFVARYITARVQPIVKRRTDIEEAIWPFNDRASLELRTDTV